MCHSHNYQINLKLLQDDIKEILKEHVGLSNDRINFEKVSQEIVIIFDKNNVIDFNKRELFKAKVRVGIKDILKSINYNSDEIDNVILSIMNKLKRFGG